MSVSPKIAFSGFAWTSASQGWATLLLFSSNLVLARLLTPEDYGVIAMASVAVALVSLVQDLGLTQAAIQRLTLSPLEASVLFWISLFFSLLLGAGLASASPWIALFFQEPRVQPITVGLALVVFSAGAQAIPGALLARDMKFRELAVVEAASASFGFLSGICYALVSPTAWALVASSLVASIARAIGCWVATRFRPEHLKLEHLVFTEAVRFGTQLSGFNLVNFFSRNSDKILIGRYFGETALGLYDRAYALMLMPLTQLLGPMGRVMIPFLSRSLGAPTSYRHAYLFCVTALLTSVHPAVIFASVYHVEFVRIVLGEKWVGAAPIFAWLGFVALHQIITSTTGWLFISQGRGHEFLVVGLYGAATTVIAVLVGLRWGPLGVAMAYALSDYAVRLPVIWWAVGRKGPVTCADLVHTALPHVAAAGAAAALLLCVKGSLGEPTAMGWLLLLPVTYAAYTCVMLVSPNKRHLLGSLLAHMRDLIVGWRQH